MSFLFAVAWCCQLIPSKVTERPRGTSLRVFLCFRLFFRFFSPPSSLPGRGCRLKMVGSTRLTLGARKTRREPDNGTGDGRGRDQKGKAIRAPSQPFYHMVRPSCMLCTAPFTHISEGRLRQIWRPLPKVPETKDAENRLKRPSQRFLALVTTRCSGRIRLGGGCVAHARPVNMQKQKDGD